MKKNPYSYTILVKAWVKKGDRYLLTKRASTEKDRAGKWALIGGKVEQESEDHILEKTIEREILEETSMKVKPDMRMIYNDAFGKGDDDYVIGIMFLCEHLSGEAKPLEDTEEVGWFTFEELVELPEKDRLLSIAVEQLQKYL